MSKKEGLKKIISHRILQKFSKMNIDEFNESMWLEHESHDLCSYLNTSEKKIDEIYCRVLFYISKEEEFEDITYGLSEVSYERFLESVDKDVEQYYVNKNSAKEWLKNCMYLKEFKSYKDFKNCDYETYDDIIEELEPNYVFFKRGGRDEYNLLIYFINQTMKEFKKDVKVRSRHLEMPEEKYVELLHMQCLRMKKLRS